MFSNKENINILTALLLKAGIKHAVVCPGSRNAPIVHNLSQVMDCVPVTDERSAGFCALGMAQKSGRPVVVCVTSGSALLNVAPAAAEAFYQHVPLIIISADRPGRWIDQQDGQTLWQAGALEKYVRRTVVLPEEANEKEAHWHCNRLVNEALIAATGSVEGPVHINVPLSEPLYNFSVEVLPEERLISVCLNTSYDARSFSSVLKRLLAAERPMIVVGQMTFRKKDTSMALSRLRGYAVVLCEKLTLDFVEPFDLIVPSTEEETERLAPDFVLYMGGTLVSKRLRQFLRRCCPEEVWEVGLEETHDTFMNQMGWLACDAETILLQLEKMVRFASPSVAQKAYTGAWKERMDALPDAIDQAELPFSQLTVVRQFMESLDDDFGLVYSQLHFANSSVVRLGNLLSSRKIWCNRGVNGIEGSLSAAAGFSLVEKAEVFCVTGDLSFFYDQNALWNDRLRGNLRILLLNNAGGGIFHKFPIDHQEKSFAYITGENHCSAEGICRQNHVDYLSAHNERTLRNVIDDFLTQKVDRAIVLEVFTDAEKDAKALQILSDEINKKTI